jgi:hypothetical protein
MRYVLLPALAAGLFLFVLPACSSSNGGSGGGTTTSGSGGTSATCPGDLAEAPDSQFCADSASPIDCALVNGAYHNQVCGVPVIAPTTALTRSANVMEYAGSGPPQLGCFAPAGYPSTGGTPQMVTMSGVARIFSSGCESNDLSIEVYTVKRTGGSDDADLGTLIGTAVMTPDDCTTSSVVSMTTMCGTRYECNYTYPNVPTETEIAIRTMGANWAPLIEYNDYIPNAQVTSGTWSHDVRALANDDYSAIPQAAIGSGIMTGFGAIAGEVHDCGNVRLSGATVGTNVANESLTYFDNDEASPLPDTSATSTSILGLYASFDIAPGPASVAALGLVDGKVTTVGYFPAYVYANSVTAVTFQGVWPFQIDAKP